jgi:ABC-type dipeptide/oligopeptide/nickel transport system ATPase component/ABC-type dipeptide/oligopeptide/nickel transport system permease subunit
MMKTRERFLTVLGSPLGILAAIACAALLFLALLAPAIWGEAAADIDTMQISKGPSPEHVFGTDGSGRDILLRTLVATRLSVVMALMATGIGVVGGVLIGLLPLIVGGRFGRWIVVGINIGVAFPGLLLAIAFSVILGQSGAAATTAIALAMVPNYGRFTHNLAASVWGRDFIAAAEVLGVPTWKTAFRHVLPNVRDPLLVNAAITAGGALVSFAGLSFLGLGIQVPEYDWGRMLNEGLTRIFVTPAAALVPGVAIILAGLTFVLLGEVLGKALTPTTRRDVKSRFRRHMPSGEASGASGPIDTDAVLSVRNLRVAAPGDKGWGSLVHGVSFDVARGEIVGIVGESGSGKSLTLTSVAGLLDSPLSVAADSAQFDGQPLTLKTGTHASSLNHHLGQGLAMIFQDPMSSLNPALSVGSQVAEPGVLHLGMSRSVARSAAIERLESVRISDAERRYGQYPHEYSGGMRQRAMIATGLMGKPALILADEPTTALDVTVQAEILSLLRRINREDGTAIVLVSHDIAVVTSLCSRVLVMYGGRIVENIGSEELKAGHAKHPYTKALLATVPTMQTDRDRPMASIPEGADFSDTSRTPG